MAKQARIAVIGAGLIGRKHIEVLRSQSPDYTLAGVADPSPAAKHEADQLGYSCWPTIGEMLDHARPDGAVIAVPNQLHASAGLACIERKVPVLIEKPVSDNMADALALIEAAESANVATLTGHHRRHNPIMRTAAEAIRAGRIGRVVAANCMWLAYKPKGYHDITWRREPGGGVVLINAIHEIDNLRMLCGDVESVYAADASAVRGFAVEDTAGAVLRFKNGAIGTLVISDTAVSPWSWETTAGENPFYPQAPDAYLRVSGTLGSIAVPTLDLHWQADGEQHWGVPALQQRLHCPPADPYYEQMRNFAAVIRGEEAPVLSGRDGTLTLATTLAITRSARTGTPVRPDELMRRP